jgi:hypothetical protein
VLASMWASVRLVAALHAARAVSDRLAAAFARTLISVAAARLRSQNVSKSRMMGTRPL